MSEGRVMETSFRDIFHKGRWWLCVQCMHGCKKEWTLGTPVSIVRMIKKRLYAQSRGVSGEEELYKHFLHRQELEIRICRDIFPNKVTVLKSKAYTDNEL